MTTSTHQEGATAAGERSAVPAIETSRLVKTFGGTRAVDGIDLVVPAGTVYGVLGPNGAGQGYRDRRP